MPQIEKALPPMARLGARTQDLTTVARMLHQPNSGVAAPMPRDTYPYAFGPGIPLQPSPLDPVRSDTGRAEPRQWQYPVSWNIHIPGQDNRLVPWQILRDAADRIAIIRDCLRIRKNEIINLDWDITITQRAIETAQRTNPSAKRIDLERDMRKRLGPQIDRCVQFWEEPDRRNGGDFPTWISKALEEHLVLDALAIYPRATLGGDLYGLEILDGTTVKPLLDHTGGRPLPPYPAYQQILYGFPRGEYTADTDDDDGLEGYAADQLIYRVKEARTFTPYGYSAVEQSLEDADLWIKRMAWLKAEYTDGVMPSGWLKNDGASGWTPDQLLGYEQDLNDVYAGMTKQRQRWRVLPPGVEPVESRQVDERYKPDYDLHLLKLMVAHFDMTIAELGFTEARGLGSAGYHEGQENIQERKGTRPTLVWLEAVLTAIARRHLAMPAELAFTWMGLDDEDQAAAEDVNQKRFMSAAMTLNERRDDAGAPRYAFAEADMPMIVTQRGVIFLDGASALAPAGEMIQPPGSAQNPQPGSPGLGAVTTVPGESGGADASPEQSAPPTRQSDTSAKAAELAAYRRWSRKNQTRPFTLEHLTRGDATAAGVDLDRVLFKAGEGDPKAPAARWAAWEKDEEAARLWAPRVSRAFAGINTQRLAECWFEVRKDADSDAWLSEQHLEVARRLNAVFTGIYADGWVIGTRSAQAALSVEAAVDWSGWAPGDERAARLIAGPALDRFLEQAGVTIQSVAAHRLSELGDALAEGLREGWGVEQLARSLRGVLDDESWAYGVALTESNRATTAASQAQYTAAGVRRNVWLDVPGACALCRGNVDAGPITVGHDFPSGATGPPGHPYCRCGIGPYLDDLA